MVRIRTVNDIVLGIIDFYKTVLPKLDLKPGQVARDLFVDGPSVQFSRLYEELAKIKDASSILLALDSDLDNLGANYGLSKKQGSKSSGIALLTFNEIEADIPITKGGIVTTSSGSSFTVVSSTTVSYTNKNTYRATASKYRESLDFVNIDDEYAIEVLVTASVIGSTGNISKYSLTSTTISGVTGVTNPSSFAGGSPVETNSAFKRRILGVFSGSNTGTATGYKNLVLADPDVIDAFVIKPGDVLMTRDGTDVYTAEDGTKTIVSEGTGGKVDIYVFGFRLIEVTDSYIYFDQSNKDDPTDSANDYVLGQIEGDEDKSVTRRRIDNIEDNELPDQPVVNIVEVTGSSSGANFAPKTTDSLGRVSGNYDLEFDTGAYAGSPWGFDKLVWIDNQIRDYDEDLTKGKLNSQDSLGFSDATQISTIVQSISVNNENSSVLASDRSIIRLSHYPVLSVSRVFNVTTGERYIIANQNPDGGDSNTTGRIKIFGNTLPAVSDILQVDYTWEFNYDPNFDYDNIINSDNIRTVDDSIDWGYSNNIRREEVIITSDGVSQKTVEVYHTVNAVVSVNTFETEENAIVTLVSNSLAVTVSSVVENVISVERDSDTAELYSNKSDGGSFSGFTIYLPSDTIAQVGDIVTVKYNSEDIFVNEDDVSGSFSGTTITLPPETTTADGTVVEVNYLAEVRQLLPATTISDLPVLRTGNNFYNNSTTSFGLQPTSHTYDVNDEIVRNLRRAPSRVKLTISGTISPGVISFSGTTFTGIFEGVFVASNDGLTHDFSSMIRSVLGLSSTESIPSGVKVAKLVSFEKVQINTNKDVLSVEHEYDIFGYELNNNDFVKRECIENSNLTRLQAKLPATTDNSDNEPETGDAFRVTFYISTTNDTENVLFSKSGSLYTQKVFAFIDSVSTSSGFISTASKSATLSLAPYNQPSQGTRYTAYYDYTAPKPNERITIKFNKNQVIGDNTYTIENAKTVEGDVLVKACSAIYVDVTLAIVLKSGYLNTTNSNSSEVVKQNVKNAVINALNQQANGTIVDESDLITVAAGINGVDRVRTLRFNKSNLAGRVLSISADKNEYIQANDVVIEVEER